MICNREIETMPREQLTILQTERLKKEIKWAYEKSPFYHKLMEQQSLTPESIQTIDDLKKMPFTTREDLVKNSPFEFLTGPLSSTLRVRSVGSIQPIVRICSNGDIARAVEMTARALVAGGINMTSIVKIGSHCLNSCILDVQYAAELVGATVIPFDGSTLEQQLKLVDMVGANVIINDSNGMLQLLVAGQALEYDLAESQVDTLFCLNDKLGNYMNDHLSARYKANIFNIYAPLESGTTAMVYECEHQQTLHLQEDNYYAEIVSLQDGSPVPDGVMGELVITSLVDEAMPYFRYRTGQIVAIDRSGICECGRTFAKLLIP